MAASRVATKIRLPFMLWPCWKMLAKVSCPKWMEKLDLWDKFNSCKTRNDFLWPMSAMWSERVRPENPPPIRSCISWEMKFPMCQTSSRTESVWEEKSLPFSSIPWKIRVLCRLNWMSRKCTWETRSIFIRHQRRGCCRFYLWTKDQREMWHWVSWSNKPSLPSSCWKIPLTNNNQPRRKNIFLCVQRQACAFSLAKLDATFCWFENHTLPLLFWYRLTLVLVLEGHGVVFCYEKMRLLRHHVVSIIVSFVTLLGTAILQELSLLVNTMVFVRFII